MKKAYDVRMAPTAVYRLFDDSGSLIYVGVSNAPQVRVSKHRWWQPWGKEIKTWTEEWHDNRAAAVAAEVAAIG